MVSACETGFDASATDNTDFLTTETFTMDTTITASAIIFLAGSDTCADAVATYYEA